ncbi:glycosyltransferase family 4 protein [Enterocloster citroniae]|uniref:glycosyltransferase family 4 protein n=1 Tax=Enterocloster citroniae TaxID=358743 RepID=UPI0008F192A4|nr:glycosyltransferase family 4 protein [Enterocloster citroniae]SFR95552.1 Glycosyltransferase involved in cell wall bisynthesis [Enterocloster citroniae]
MEHQTRILFTRALKGFPDSRLEKEVYSLSKKYSVSVFGWDRENKYKKVSKSENKVFGKKIIFYHVGIPAPNGEGFSKLLLPLLKFWSAEYKFLINKKDSFDIIHACDFDTALIAFLAAKRLNKKIVYDIFDYYAESHKAPKIIKYLIKKIDTFVISKSDATIICSELRRKQIGMAKPNNLIVIHNTPIENKSLQEGTEDLNYCNRKIRLVYVGLLSDDRFLENISNVICSRKDIEWHIGGWGKLDNYFKKLSEQYKNIIYYGMMPYTDVLKLEKKCDLMTAIYDPNLPNHTYAAPNKFYEALMIKKPLIMVQGTGMDSYITEYNLGEVINLNGHSFEESFSQAITNLIGIRGYWKQMGENGYMLYKSEFSWDEMERRLLSLYSLI